MKLWVRLTCISLVCTLAALITCMGIFTAWQSERIIDDAKEQAQSLLSLFCSNLSSLEDTPLNRNVSALTKRSIVQYYFLEYAHLLGGKMQMSLAQSGEYLCNIGPLDPRKLIGTPEPGEQICVSMDMDVNYYMIARSIDIMSQQYTIYLVSDISDAHAKVRNMRIITAAMLAMTAIIVAAITAHSVRRSLKPLGELRNTAKSIAQGKYDLRAHIDTGDEVASLAESFNDMADAVQSRIDELTEESERRRILLGALAHELKTPMTAIIGFAESMLRLPLSEEQRRSSLERIVSAGKRTERMSQKLMQLLAIRENARIVRRKFALDALGAELAHLYDGRVHICAAGSMYGDRDLLFSLVQNLINNALSAAAGAVNVSLSPGMIEVSDDGRGIPPEHIARLTEPFYRVDKARSRMNGGAGLGLALCSAIAEAHGGRLNIDSVPGCGTTVRVVLDCAQARHG